MNREPSDSNDSIPRGDDRLLHPDYDIGHHHAVGDEGVTSTTSLDTSSVELVVEASAHPDVYTSVADGLVDHHHRHRAASDGSDLLEQRPLQIMEGRNAAAIATDEIPSNRQSLFGASGGGGDGVVGVCLVCCDRGSGFHYGVFSCEGCKGFFKRTVQKNLNYACKEKQNCIVDKYTRNNCQYCRFQKCCDVGMKREAVREDRTPGGKHRVKRSRYDEDMSSLLVDPEPLDSALINSIINAKAESIPTIDNKLFEGNEDGSANTLSELMQYGYAELKLIIMWAKKVPGFLDLSLEDQMALLKSSFMELNVLRLAFRSLETPGRVRFSTNVILSPRDGVDVGWGKDLINATLEFVSRMKDVYMDTTEFNLLNVLVLTYPDASGIKEKSKVTNLQNRFLNSLRAYTALTYPNDARHYGKLLLRLPALRSVSTKAMEKFLSLSLSGSIKMTALVQEMIS
ncbi:retinoic acid receptor RXR-alpha-B-like [Tubulanus polymorphus]|uniref:retinoic acid receptor RXR-alpha-B-like n=1 Tax=Tubulanus polymorphus TaxID=672921 RepID=UPI003DA27B48